MTYSNIYFDLQPDEPIEASIIVSTKCEIAENYQILLRGLIISRPPDPVKSLEIEDLELTCETPAAEEKRIASPGPSVPASS